MIHDNHDEAAIADADNDLQCAETEPQPCFQTDFISSAESGPSTGSLILNRPILN